MSRLATHFGVFVMAAHTGSVVHVMSGGFKFFYFPYLLKMRPAKQNRALDLTFTSV